MCLLSLHVWHQNILTMHLDLGGGWHLLLLLWEPKVVDQPWYQSSYIIKTKSWQPSPRIDNTDFPLTVSSAWDKRFMPEWSTHLQMSRGTILTGILWNHNMPFHVKATAQSQGNHDNIGKWMKLKVYKYIPFSALPF